MHAFRFIPVLLIPLLLITAAPGCGDAPPEEAAEASSPTFKRVRLYEEFYTEGANAGDFNNDGVLDVVAGPYWYEGPAFEVRHEFYEPRTFDPERYSDNFFPHAYDLDGDGWEDIFVIGFPGEDARWFRNPQGEEGHWERYEVFRPVDNESPAWVDIDADGRPEIVCNANGFYGYVEVGWDDPTRPWTFHPISPNEGWGNFTHGMGVGDVDGDGRLDLLERDGWWEQPASLEGDPVWVRHEVDFGEGGAQMYAYDFDDDGDNDVVTSLVAHGWGLSWFEQVDRDGAIAFVEHNIMGRRPETDTSGFPFAELHGVDLVDMDGDGVLDVITGKRYWAHGSDGGPDDGAPALTYWFRTIRRADGGVEFVPHMIDDDTGVGVMVIARDITADGRPDVIVGNKKGFTLLLRE